MWIVCLDTTRESVGKQHVCSVLLELLQVLVVNRAALLAILESFHLPLDLCSALIVLLVRLNWLLEPFLAILVYLALTLIAPGFQRVCLVRWEHRNRVNLLPAVPSAQWAPIHHLSEAHLVLPVLLERTLTF